MPVFLSVVCLSQSLMSDCLAVCVFTATLWNKKLYRLQVFNKLEQQNKETSKLTAIVLNDVYNTVVIVNWIWSIVSKSYDLKIKEFPPRMDNSPDFGVGIPCYFCKTTQPSEQTTGQQISNAMYHCVVCFVISILSDYYHANVLFLMYISEYIFR